MSDSFQKFGGLSAITVGVLSLLYAIFYLVVQPQAPFVGALVSWLILSISGIFSLAAYIALYQRTRAASEGYALFGLLFGVVQSMATLLNSGYRALLVWGAVSDVPLSPLDPKGLATFFIFALASLVFGRLILRGVALPRTLGYVALFNALLLVVLFFANVFGSVPLILLSGGLSSVIVTPLWWIWLGRELRGEGMMTHAAMQSQPA